MVSLFERLDKGRPPPTRKAQEPSPAQKLLDWLQHWSKPTVSARDICIYGPNAIRDRQRAIELGRNSGQKRLARPHQDAAARHA